MEKSLGVKFDEELKKKMKVRVAQLGISIKTYLTELVEKDIEEANQAEKKSDNA